MLNWFFKILGLNIKHKSPPPNIHRERLKHIKLPSLIYAIGDVHGCLDLLQNLEKQIEVDCKKEKQDALIIMLGDYVDRGAQTAELIEHLISPPAPSIKRLCLAGNHEEAMLAFLDNPKANIKWLEFGGYETLLSYGFSASELNLNSIKKRNFIHKINSFIPDEHINFLSKLPIIATFPKHIFVHAGIRPNISIEKQTDRDLLWIRDSFLKHEGDYEFTIIHGHTPVEKTYISPSRINVDTGAYLSGHLSAIKIINGEISDILTT